MTSLAGKTESVTAMLSPARELIVLRFPEQRTSSLKCVFRSRTEASWNRDSRDAATGEEAHATSGSPTAAHDSALTWLRIGKTEPAQAMPELPDCQG